MNNSVEKIQQVLEPVFKRYSEEIVFAYCFGSVAKGNSSVLSDVDLAIFVKNTEQKNRLKIDLYTDCSRALKRNDIDVVILNGFKNLVLAFEIILDGVVIYDSNTVKRTDYELKTQHAALDFKYQRKKVMGI